MSDCPTPSMLERCIAEHMVAELESQRLTVVLVPGMEDNGRWLRAVEIENPQWYRRFCGHYSANRRRRRNGRKPDTLIKRQNTLRALREIESGRCQTEYAQRIYPFVQEAARDYAMQFERERERMVVYARV